MKRIFTTLLLLIMGFTFWVIYHLYFSERESLAIELSKEIETFKVRRGHYPNCNRSVDLIDSLELNGNEWYPEYFSYYLDAEKKYYVIKIYSDNKVEDVYDSRAKKVSKYK